MTVLFSTLEATASNSEISYATGKCHSCGQLQNSTISVIIHTEKGKILVCEKCTKLHADKLNSNKTN